MSQTQKAEGRRQSGTIGSMVLCAVFAVLICVAGCGEKVSPAAARSSAVSTAAVVEQAAAPAASSGPTSLEKTEPAAPASVPEKKEPEKTTAVDAAQEAKRPARDISFDTVKFKMDKEELFERKMLTPAIEKLVNRKVRIRGYILPGLSFEQTFAQFVLVRDNLECCFGPGAALYDCMVVNMNEGKMANFTNRPIAVEGVFSIQEIPDGKGKHIAIYHLQADKVQ